MTTITYTCISRMQILHLFTCLWLMLQYLPQNTGKNTGVRTARECHTGTFVFEKPQCNHDPNLPLMNIKDAKYEASSCSLEPPCENNPTNQPECEVHVPTVDQKYYSDLQTKCGGETACKELHAHRMGYPDCPKCLNPNEPSTTDQIRIDFTCEKDLSKKDLCPAYVTSYNINDGYLFKSWNGIKDSVNCMCKIHADNDTPFQLSIKQAYMQLKTNHSDCLHLRGKLKSAKHDSWYNCDGKDTSQDVLAGLTYMDIEVNLMHTKSPINGLMWLHVKADQTTPVTVKCWPAKSGEQHGAARSSAIAIATAAALVLLFF